jgi:hypothetical protein
MQLNTGSIEFHVADRQAQENRNSHDPSATLRRFERLRDKIAPRRNALLNHPIYAEIDSLSTSFANRAIRDLKGGIHGKLLDVSSL